MAYDDPSPPNRPKKDTDFEALRSPLARIPGLSIAAARDLIDLGFYHVADLVGRAPEALYAELRQLRPKTPKDRLAAIRLAVYFAETPEPDPALLQAWKWAE